MTIGLWVGIAFLLLGLFTLRWNERKRLLAESACNWPVANAHICESRVQYARPKMDESDCLIFSYRYEVDGVSHIGKSIDLFALEDRLTLAEMEDIARTYPQGAQVKIHYDARYPAVSVIEPGHRVAYFRNRRLGALLALAGCVALGLTLFS